MNRLNLYYGMACLIGAVTAGYLCVYAANTGIRVVSAILLTGLGIACLYFVDGWRR